MPAEQCQKCFFSEYLFQGHPVCDARKFQSKTGLWFQKIKRHEHDYTYTCMSWKLENTIYTYTCVSRTQLITITPTLLWPETINSVIVTFRTLSLLQYRFIVFAQHFVILCDHFSKFVRKCDIICAHLMSFLTSVTFSFGHFQISQLGSFGRMNEYITFTCWLSFWVLAQEEELLFLFPSWSPFPLIQLQVVLQLSLL